MSMNSFMPSTLGKTTHRSIIGLPPLTDPRTIQQREQVVREVYGKLVQPDITAITLTGMGGVGKSTLAALIYRYVEELRRTHNSPFLAETLWFTIDPAVTFAELAGNLFEAFPETVLKADAGFPIREIHGSLDRGRLQFGFACT